MNPPSPLPAACRFEFRREVRGSDRLQYILRSFGLFVLSVVFCGIVGGCGNEPSAGGGSAGKGWPTEAEVKAAVQKGDEQIHASEHNKSVWHVKGVRHEFKEIVFARQTAQKQMDFGASAREVYPVKVHYTLFTDYTDKPATSQEYGTDGQVLFFYKDSFDQWTWKRGNP